jgi:hypothetical protein
MATESITYDRIQLRGIQRAFKAMTEEATSQAKTVANSLATYLQSEIKTTASKSRNRAASRIADGSSVSKSSKTGELSFGFARQKFSGGGTTQQLWGGYEFGSNRYKQFPLWSGRFGRGSRGWFIYPTLRSEQPYIVNRWESAFKKIREEW